jgi:hypothetical protein
MNRTRIVFLLSCGLFAALSSTDIIAAELIEREGQFIRLTTDLESAAEAEALVATFDAAVPQWVEFWNLDQRSLADWKVDACVIRDKGKFQAAGLIPQSVPDFPFGYAFGNKVWALAQQSEYYTRHLLLHEGVHSLAFHAFGGAGPTWFMEGTAELLATHSGVSASTKVNQIPVNREAVPYWGRFKLMDELRVEQKIPAFEQVLQYQPNLIGDVASYGWSWAAVMLLQTYPEYQPAFQAAAKNGRKSGAPFNRDLNRSLSKDWPIIAARWRLMCHDLNYGFDWQRERVTLSASDPIWDGSAIQLQVAADQGWQSSGKLIRPGTTLKITPAGQVTVAETTKPWVSEPSGITLEFRRGRPLGQLLMCVLPTVEKSEQLPELEIQPVVAETTFTTKTFSWLLFRVNDGVGELADNRGAFELQIE